MSQPLDNADGNAVYLEFPAILLRVLRWCYVIKVDELAFFA
jgi:hypothetical protein